MYTEQTNGRLTANFQHAGHQPTR